MAIVVPVTTIVASVVVPVVPAVPVIVALSAWALVVVGVMVHMALPPTVVLIHPNEMHRLAASVVIAAISTPVAVFLRCHVQVYGRRSVNGATHYHRLHIHHRGWCIAANGNLPKDSGYIRTTNGCIAVDFRLRHAYYARRQRESHNQGLGIQHEGTSLTH